MLDLGSDVQAVLMWDWFSTVNGFSEAQPSQDWGKKAEAGEIGWVWAVLLSLI